MKRALITSTIAMLSLPVAAEETFTVCRNSDCVSVGVGTYRNPVVDQPFTGDWSAPVHRGMYCVNGEWHYGFLRYWERSPVIKPSCGIAIDQMPG